jgi:hypothetical protein
VIQQRFGWEHILRQDRNQRREALEPSSGERVTASINTRSDSGLEGFGFKLRRGLVIPGAGALDGVLGAALGAAVALGIVWIAAAVAAQAPGESSLRSDIQRSVILRKLNELLPPSGPILGALARLDCCRR